ncbi:MAG: hypothetical protein M1821_003026 [Bathelium mastoideum]|nr:MAG: hypothetical protein M1821_003026 [Bathelium mastoideum]KAI9681916.1 MAG: hypothetical protein M1822_006993 [Bathelium mastoideum]
MSSISPPTDAGLFTSPAYRTLYVLVYPSRLFAAHWSFWLPYLDTESHELEIGHRIHVTGDRLNGFTYDFENNYDVRGDDRRPNRFPMGFVSAAHLNEEKLNEGSVGQVQVGPYNAFGRACRDVPAPGPSLNRVTESNLISTRAIPKATEVKDCQWWIKQAVAHLVEERILLPRHEDPRITAGKLPSH